MLCERSYYNDEETLYDVLILVLMEDALRVIKRECIRAGVWES